MSRVGLSRVCLSRVGYGTTEIHGISDPKDKFNVFALQNREIEIHG